MGGLLVCSPHPSPEEAVMVSTRWTEHRPRRHLVQGVAVWLCLTASGVARAEPPDARARALELFDQGARAFREGDLATAISRFEQAWALTPDGLIAYNLTLANTRAGDVDAAWRWARLAEDAGLGADVADKHRARQLGLGTALAARKLTSTRRDAPPHGGTEQAPPSDDGVTSLLGLGAAALGMSLLAGAWLVDAGLEEDITAYEAAARDGNAALYQSRKENIESSQQLGQILLYSGVASLLTGAVLWLWSGEDDAGAITLAPLPDGGAVVWSVPWPATLPRHREQSAQ